MNSRFKYALEIAKALFLAKIFRRRVPLFVSWALTYRCNSRCRYCDMPARAVKEMDFTQVRQTLEILAKKGSRFLSLTGGEPLLRDDIGMIVDLAWESGLCVKLNSNGSLFAQKAKDLRKLSALGLSFDGPASVHDALRGNGSHAAMMQAADAAKNNRIPVSFQTVLSETNLDFVKDILSIAEKMQIKVLFQPATQTLYGSTRLNPVVSAVEKYRLAMARLIKEKKEGNPWILNSPGGLSLLAQWPEPVEIRCVNGFLGCRIEPDGQVRLCSLIPQTESERETVTHDFEKSFDLLPAGVECRNCWCAAQIELNRVATLKWDAIVNALGLL